MIQFNHVKFNDNVCNGDFIATTVGNVEVRATIVADEDTKPSDFDCYTNEERRAWGRGEWYFCGIVLSIRANGIVVDDHHESLWGIDTQSGAYLTEVANDMARRVDLTEVALHLDGMARTLRDARDAALGMPVIPHAGA
jgi:hypothetical protein